MSFQDLIHLENAKARLGTDKVKWVDTGHGYSTGGYWERADTVPTEPMAYFPASNPALAPLYGERAGAFKDTFAREIAAGKGPQAALDTTVQLFPQTHSSQSAAAPTSPRAPVVPLPIGRAEVAMSICLTHNQSYPEGRYCAYCGKPKKAKKKGV